jgi:ribosomal-protein-alanine N-acetyltransferase
MCEDNIEKETLYDWIFTLKETGEPFGSGGVAYNKEHQMYELGYGLMKSCWGKGLGTEAAREILRFAIEELKQTRFFACHYINNLASGKILEKLGFIYSGIGTTTSYDGSSIYDTKEYYLDI